MPFDTQSARDAGYSDDEISVFLAKDVGFDLAGAQKAGYSPSEIVGHLSTLAVEDLSKRSGKTSRTWAESAKDGASSFGASVNNTLKTLTDLAGTNNPVSEFLGENAKSWQSNYSPAYKAELQKQNEEKAALGSDPSYLSRAKLAAIQTMRNPIEGVGELAGNIAPMMIGGLAGMGTKGMMALSGAMGAGAVKGGIAETIENAPEEALMSDPLYAKMRGDGMSQKEAKTLLGEQRASYGDAYGKILLGGGIGLAVGKFGSVENAIANIGKQKVAQNVAKDSLLKGVTIGAAKEVATEIPQEMTETYLGNTGASARGAKIASDQGVIEAGVKAGILSAVGGGLTGVSGRGPQPMIQATQPEQVSKTDITPEATAPQVTPADIVAPTVTTFDQAIATAQASVSKPVSDSVGEIVTAYQQESESAVNKIDAILAQKASADQQLIEQIRATAPAETIAPEATNAPSQAATQAQAIEAGAPARVAPEGQSAATISPRADVLEAARVTPSEETNANTYQTSIDSGLNANNSTTATGIPVSNDGVMPAARVEPVIQNQPASVSVLSEKDPRLVPVSQRVASESNTSPTTKEPLTQPQRQQIDAATEQQLEALYQKDVKDAINQRLGRATPDVSKAGRTPFKSFLREHGINSSVASDVTGERGIRANSKLPATFRKNGLNLDLLAERAVEAGFMTQAELDSADDNGGTNRLVQMIQAEISGKSQETLQTSNESTESQSERIQRAEIEGMADKLGLPYDGEISTDRLASMVKRVNDRLESENLKSWGETKGGKALGRYKADRVLQYAKSEVARIERKRVQYERELEGFAEASIKVQDALLDVLVNVDGNFAIVRQADIQAEAAWNELNGQWEDQNGQANTTANGAAPEASAPDNRGTRTSAENAREGSTEPQQSRAAEEGLTAPTRTDILAQQERAAQAEKDQAAADKAKEKAAKESADKKEIDARQDASADNFQLGQSAEDSLSGQASMFDEKISFPDIKSSLKPKDLVQWVKGIYQKSDGIDKHIADNIDEKAITALKNTEKFVTEKMLFKAPIDPARDLKGGDILVESGILTEGVGSQIASRFQTHRLSDAGIALVRHIREIKDKPASKMSVQDLLRAAAQKMDDAAKPQELQQKQTVSGESIANTATKTVVKIEDSGAVLEGARKLYAKAYADKLGEGMKMDLAAVPLSKSWPEPDYQRMLDDGADPWAVAFAHAARDEVPNKPSASWKLRGWVNKVTLLRDFTAQVMDGKFEKDTIITKATESLGNWLNKIDLYEAVGHGTSLKDMTFHHAEYSFIAGQELRTPRMQWSINKGHWGNIVATDNTKAGAIEKFKEWMSTQEAAPTAKAATSFDIYSRTGKPGFIIGKRAGVKTIDLKTFDTVKEAREYKNNNQAELEKLLADAKFVPNERRDTNAPRVGEDHRNGADVTTEKFRETFGFRGEQFGASMPQAERQANMNQAYDALMDLAGVIGIPPKALSLNGELGLAFGARGHGGKNPFAAHYEADSTGEVTANRVVINLTRKNGAGSLAHEWFHAVDNYFARMQGQQAGFMTERIVQDDRVRMEMKDAFRSLMKAINTTSIKERSKTLDKLKTKDYWSTGLEMAARSFESYVIAKLQDQNASNDYLANITSEAAWSKENGYPYPTAGETPAIRAAFDNFFQVVQTKETDKGVAMFARDGQSATNFGNIDPNANETTNPNGNSTLAETMPRGRDDSSTEREAAASQSERPLFSGSFSAELSRARTDPAQFQRTALVGLGRVIAREMGVAEPSIGAYSTAKLVNIDELNQIAKVFGKEIIGFKQNSANPAMKNAFGFFSGVSVGGDMNDLIFISRDNTRPHLSLLGHELVHTMRRDNPALYNELVNIVNAYTKTAYYKANFGNEPVARGLTDDSAIREEFMGEVLSDGFTDVNFWNAVAAKNKTLFERIVGALGKLIDRVRTSFGQQRRTEKYLTDFDKVMTLAGEVMAKYGVSNKTNTADDVKYSSSKPLQTDTSAFKAWFGSSKVVDANGKPLVVYHGTKTDVKEFSRSSIGSATDEGFLGDGFYFTDDPRAASGYAKGIGGNVIPAYLSIKVPYYADGLLPDYITAESLQKSGYDGVIYKTDGTNDYSEYVSFNPEQIKSSIGNSGNFDPANPDIRFARNAPDAVPEESKWQGRQRVVQDKFNRFKVLQNWLTDKGITLSEGADVYQAETLMSGRIASRKEDFREKQMQPLIAKTQKAGISMEDIGDYLKAQHAPEANKRARELHNDDTATAFGVTDDEAKATIDEFKKQANFAELKDLANEWRDITTQTKQILLDGGILSKDMVAAWDATYSAYIPVKGSEESQGTGKGLSVNGKTKRRMGHGLRDEAILENILRDHERAIQLDENNNVGKALIRFALEAKNDDIITVGQPEKRQIMKAGEVMLQASPMLAENEVNVYIDGHAVRVQINDEIAARAYTALGVEHLNTVLSAAREVNTWLSKAYTGYSPDFILTNPIRDAIQGSMTLTGEYGALTAAKIFTNYPKAVKELVKHFNNHGSSQLVTDYRANGGSTGAAYLSDLERIGNDLQASYDEYAGVMDTYTRAYDEAVKDGRKTPHLYAAMRSGIAGIKKVPVVGHFLRLMESVNAVTENALRVATFDTLVKDGVSPSKAAAQAKNLMNFNRKGEIANTAGALYLFFNPSVQGSQVMFKALVESEHKGQVQALAGMMVLSAIALAELAMSGGADDEEKWKNTPDYVKDGNLVIGFGDKQFTLTLPYGYRVFHTLGNVISEYMHGGNGYKLGIRLASSVFSNFSPLGNPMEGNVQGFSMLPTIPKMLLGPSVNQDSFGREIAPKQWNNSKPDSQIMNRNTKGTVYASTSSGLNSFTGGNDYKKGLVDVSPETLKYWVSSLTGGAGKFAFDMVNIPKATYNEVPLATKDIPIARRFIREVGVSDTRSAFWERAKEAKDAADAFDAAKKAHDGLGAQSILKDNSALIALSKYAESQQKVVKAKRDEADRINANKDLTPKQKNEKLKLIEMQESAVYTRFIKIFDERTKVNK